MSGSEDYKMEFYSKISTLHEVPEVKIELRNLVDGLIALLKDIDAVIANPEIDRPWTFSHLRGMAVAYECKVRCIIADTESPAGRRLAEELREMLLNKMCDAVDLCVS